jgi:hypothetical protein
MLGHVWKIEDDCVNWVVGRLRSFDLFTLYLNTLVGHRNQILFGLIPTLPYVVWWLAGSPPGWLASGTAGWVMLVAGYYAWRGEYISKTSSSRPKLVGVMSTSLRQTNDSTGTIAQLHVTLWNRGGMPSIAKNWTLSWASGNRHSLVIVLASHPNEAEESSVASIEERSSDKEAIPSGGEAHYTLRCKIPIHRDLIARDGLELKVSFLDVMDVSSTIRGVWPAAVAPSNIVAAT